MSLKFCIRCLQLTKSNTLQQAVGTQACYAAELKVSCGHFGICSSRNKAIGKEMRLEIREMFIRK